MKNLVSFDFDGNDVRVIEKDGNPWWIAKDVCDILELGNISMAVERLDEDEKLVSKLLMSGQNRDVWLVNESGLYSLIIRSNKPEAKKFKRWITHEVLPQIRKTGNYSTAPATLKEALLLAYNQQCEIEEKDALLLEAQPKIEAHDRFLTAKGNFTMNEVAKQLGTGQNKLFERLRNGKILMDKKGHANHNIPYQDYIDRGYFTLITTTINNVDRVQTLVTPNGLDWLSKLLR